VTDHHAAGSPNSYKRLFLPPNAAISNESLVSNRYRRSRLGVLLYNLIAVYDEPRRNDRRSSESKTR
jgi:hypothetical protein